MRVEIPEIGVDAQIVRLGVGGDGTLQVPSNPAEAGWWSGGASPGARGPAVIVGHINWDGLTGVFGHLSQLRDGDPIAIVSAHGVTDHFTVTAVGVYPKGSFPTKTVYGPLRYAGLRLITCVGTFDPLTGHYTSNLIVFARLASPSVPGGR